MPMYEYKCKCSEEFEKIVPHSEREVPQECKCGELVKRVEISQSTFRLEGKWFKTAGEY